ncbi:MAG TPA: hypothetical protein VMS17_24745 [Gemmataceae bacterium]|nr:hypothetical protein [Gemmataceae bacterium]
MLRTALVTAAALAALAVGPLASTARAETPRQVWLQNHPIAAANIWAENHPYRSGLLPYVPPADRVIVGPVVAPPVVVDPIVRVYHPFWRFYP